MQPVLLVDASVYVFRAWHSLPEDILDADGEPAQAVHGFSRFLLELLERTRPRHVLVAFDEALESSFRNAWYPPYKANRDPAPESLKRQFKGCRAVAEALGLTALSDSSYEADDLIGSAQHRLRAAGFPALIVSADKDLSQLLRDGDEQWDYARQNRWGPEGVRERYGAVPEAIADFLGLTGDAVDNIPGVPGIGPKTASALLDHFATLEQVLERVDEVPFLRIRGAASHARRLKEHADQARLSKRLATIVCDARVPEQPEDYLRRPINEAQLHQVFDRYRIGPLSRRRALSLSFD
ncbi:MAG: exodeoxyribonuclease IX [Xanthomonadales bacterium]|nr:exodeoxyribonuclease IX [Xanthomonadales bacterium]